MILDLPGSPLLAYCTNIHPGETWPEVRRNLGAHLPAVRKRLGETGLMGVGPRLSAPAARGLALPGAMEELQEFLRAGDYRVFTINGFPYGEFHAGCVKENAYEPDWRDDRRVEYHDLLARLLAQLTPDGGEGSVSTVPGAFRANVRSDKDAALIARNVARHAATLVQIFKETGRLVTINLEPEPFCFLETVTEAATFLPRVFEWEGRDEMSRLSGLNPAQAEEALRRHVGVCVDCCHLAVMFESPEEAVALLRREGVRIGKVQLSAALAAKSVGPAEAAALAPFAEGRYLHQTIQRGATDIRRYPDLPDALAAYRSQDEPREWRVHFHVPVYHERLGLFDGTRDVMFRLLDIAKREAIAPHYEVETYAWDVLPPEHRGRDVDDDIARELACVKDWVKS